MSQSTVKDLGATDEVTPLLNAPVGNSVGQAAHKSTLSGESAVAEGEDVPLPMGQIVLLCYARLVEPVAFFSIFPFIKNMIMANSDIDEAGVGFYAGLIESIFSLTQMILMMFWGRAADRFGRKPILVYSMLGVSICTALFGLSKTLWQMIMFRCMAGVFAGTILTIRTMISENSTARTQARAFSLFAFSGNLGIFVGPLIGGVLAEPATAYPSVFGKVRFFQEYPYVLSTSVVGLVGLSAVIACALFLKETLDPHEDGKKAVAPPMSTMEILKSPGVGFVLFINSHTMLLAFAYTAVIPIFEATSVELGGWGFSPLYISIVLASVGISQALWTLLVFPPLQNRIGTGGVLRVCFTFYPLFFLLNPLGNTLLRNNLRTLFWAIVPAGTLIGVGTSMSFIAVQLAVNDISPSHRTLGTVNALASTLMFAVRAVAPALFSSIFAQSVRKQILHGYLVWLILFILAVVARVAIRWLPERAEGRIKRKDTTQSPQIADDGAP